MSSRSAVIVPEAGEPRPKEPWPIGEGRAAPGKRTVGGKDAEYTGILGQHVHETTTDSKSGRAACRGKPGERGASHRCGCIVPMNGHGGTAAGIDGVTADEYEAGLEGELRNLADC